MMKPLTLSLLLCLFLESPAQNPLYIPDTMSGSVLNLSLKTGTVQFYPQQVTATFGANGNILAPTLILRKGQQVTMNVANNLPDTSTIHWHGMHVSPANDGGPHISIAPGATWSPAFQVRDQASTYWYHPHLHEYTNEQVQKGLSGFIIVRDSAERLLNLPRTYGVDDFPMVLQTKAFDANKQIVVLSALDSVLMVNATIRPSLNVPAQLVRLRLLNGASERSFYLGFTGNKVFYQIGSDGGLLSAPVALTRLRLSPGERAEVLVDLSNLNGQNINLINYTTELPSGNYGAVQPGMGAGQTIPNYALNPLNTATYTVVRLNVQAPNANAVSVLPQSLISPNPWPQNSAVQSRSLTITPANMGQGAIQGPFMFDNQLYNMSVINHTVALDNTEIWTIRNQSPISHPFHIHDVQFYVLDINGAAPPANLSGRKDVILVPGGNGTVRFITKFETFCDEMYPYMYHCHMLTHEDEGTLGQFLVLCPSTTGLADLPGIEPMNLFPNPVSDRLTVTVPRHYVGPYTLMDILGQVVQEGTLIEGVNYLDLHPFTPGLYFLQANVGGSGPMKVVKD